MNKGTMRCPWCGARHQKPTADQPFGVQCRVCGNWYKVTPTMHYRTQRALSPQDGQDDKG